MNIELRNLTRRHWPSAFILASARRSAQYLKLSPNTTLEIVLVGTRCMRALNHTWRKKDRPTTVLSFGESQGFAGSYDMLGEIFLCPAEIQKRAAKSGISFRKELTHLLVHGILHLVGEDHECSVARRRMERKENEILTRLFNGRPLYFCN